MSRLTGSGRVLLCGLLGATLSLPSLNGHASAPQTANTAASRESGSPSEGWHASWLRLPLQSPAQIWFRAGSFQMGSSSEDALQAFLQCKREPWGHRCEPTQFANETPPRTILLSGYWLDRTEVTVRDYQRCVDVGRCRPVRYASGAKRFAQARFPV
ncbi:MAG TPA: SUMF1/EgtB/PvdO family nonheme iron enzyme, partial [Polyangiaceae bacterium]|nr:SUMF1/EgtB/PvdO family nonheme iron enzyme [Polyangiaceae bacterium]